MCPSRSQPGSVLGEDMTVLPSFYPGGHGELERKSSVCVVGWMDLGWWRSSREVALGPARCQVFHLVSGFPFLCFIMHSSMS